MNSSSPWQGYVGSPPMPGSGNGIVGASSRASLQSQSRDNGGKMKHITFGSYIIGPTLGEGEFGKVKLGWSKAKSKKGSRNVAIKLVRRDSIPKNSEKEVKIFREINALKSLRHPSIVRLEEVLQNSKYIGIVLQYASGGEFYKYIQKKRRLKDAQACRLFAQLISGVHYLHHRGLAHRDLKLENLLLDEHENLLITDFGFVNQFRRNDMMKTSCGSPCYAAPELVVTTKPYEARKADVWSCGVILYAMLAGYLPWDDDPENPEGDDIARLYHYITKTNLKFPEYITPLPRDLLRRILVPNPELRLTIEQIEKHLWLQPHAHFFSWSPEGWVAKTKTESENSYRVPPSKNLTPKSSCSASSTNSKGDKRNSLVIDSTLYPQPAPPQECPSHAFTKPTSPTGELGKVSPVRIHARCNSAASIALQAVVDAEKDFFRHSQSTHSLHSDSSAQQTPPISAGRNPPYGIPKSVTHSNAISTSLMNEDSIIIEVSPQKSCIHTIVIANNKEVAKQPSSNKAGPLHPSEQSTLIIKKDKTSQHSNSLPQSNRKPRPTSYQPVGSSYLVTSDYTFGKPMRSPFARKRTEHNQVDQIMADPIQKLTSAVTSDRTASDNGSKKLRIPDENCIPEVDIYDIPVKQDLSAEVTPGENIGMFRNVDTKYFKRTSSVPIDTKLDIPETVNQNHIDSTPISAESESSLNPNPLKTNAEEKGTTLSTGYSYYSNSKTSMQASIKGQGYTGQAPDAQKMPLPLAAKENEDSWGYIAENQPSNIQKPNSGRLKDTVIQARTQRFSMFAPKSKPIITDDSKSKRKANRNSLTMISSNQHADSNRQREQSTAKRVFDFFKRRSLRL
ncbi:HBR150Cp [Eremothecium sinecaudum]|uniref:non-specific serine/threonine protein kinase n=1 Tax=Eremothecium sinecaudum TaxID=45286 RepID=A0A120K172_9SACH|nr:HBR150Cp [Eremothecium sinecaudum]AMD19051.1 HBR150Cp [Eremothecium sinecaudum]